ncbi:GIY-YIG nuclease family protein [Candidatus Binatia bacterium]|nr:GIY-YIG nuclease family protein [Candidatus Binatia bacterium]
MRSFYAYMLRCSDGSFYVGHTDDLARRVAEHEIGAVGGYTASRRPVELVWSDEFQAREEALAAELRIKGWNRAKKESLLHGDWDRLRLAAKKQDWGAYRERRSRS